MRILVISDIHANLEALEACLAAAQGKYDVVFNLGDIVGYGASPNEVVDRSRGLGGVVVRGNHDKACSGVTDANDFNPMAAYAAYWTKRALNEQNLAWVRDLPPGPASAPDIPGVSAVHGSPLDEDEYLIIVRDAYEALGQPKVPLTFFGHTHIQGGFAKEGEQYLTLRPLYDSDKEAEHFAYRLSEGGVYLINPGSAGQPRDGDWRAAFAIYDTDVRVVEFNRVPYDVESAQRRILSANLPDRLAARLREGR